MCALLRESYVRENTTKYRQKRCKIQAYVRFVPCRATSEMNPAVPDLTRLSATINQSAFEANNQFHDRDVSDECVHLDPTI